MKSTIYVLLLVFFGGLFGQAVNRSADDFKYYGRKEPMSMGSAFGALGSSALMLNPANIAFISDNRISMGGYGSGNGFGYYLAWMAPNFSIGEASQYVETESELDSKFRKKTIQFNFGISTTDLGLTGDTYSIAAGINIKRMTDLLYDYQQNSKTGGSVTGLDIGLLIKLRLLLVEFALIDLNEPENKDGQIFKQGTIVGVRYENLTGLKIALQSQIGDRYNGTDFGLHLAAEQMFFERRLISRIQLTSYFKGPEAIMQNISGSVGYRFSSKGRLWTPLRDLELNYTLSFLTLPKNIGTQMLGLAKYF